MKTFRLPDLGEGLQEAEIITWHVGVGDHVVANQPMVAVETDKAVVDIPSPYSGRIARLRAAPGEVVATGAAMVDFDDTGHRETGTVVGHIPGIDRPATAPVASVSTSGAVRATPAVRALAKRLGVDITQVTGSGPHGCVTSDDVKSAPTSSGAEALRGVRRAMAQNMERAGAAVVPATVTDVAVLGAWGSKVDVTIRLIRAIAAGCTRAPALNAWYLGPEQSRQLHERVDLGIAMDTAEGLFVPVLRNVANRSADELRKGLESMKADVAARSVPLQQLRGQTITLSNFGMFGGRHAALVVIPPQVAILGAGRIHDEVVAIADRPCVRPVLPLSLTFDHRAVMGREAAQFLAAVREDLENSV